MRIPRALAKYIDVVNHPGYYVKTEVDKIKKKAIAEAKKIGIAVLGLLLMGLVGLFLLVFVSVTLALFLNDVLDSAFYGFLIVTGLYLLALLALAFIFKDPIMEVVGGGKQDDSLSRQKHLEEVSTVVTTDPTAPANGRVETTYVTRQDV